MASEQSQLWIVRHGQTEWSRDGRHTSTTDVPLTEEGERVARSLEPRLADVGFALVLTSPMERARRTAELAGFADAEADPDLREWDYGDYEGLTTEAIRESVADWVIWTHGASHGETASQVATRLDRVVERVRRADGPALVFGHGHASRALAARWLGRPVSDGGMFRIDTATISRLAWEHGRPAVDRWNA